MLALGQVTDGHAQSRPGGQRGDQAVLPIVNSGRIEGFLLLEPADSQWRSGDRTLDAAFGLDQGDSLGLLCDHKAGIASALVNLTSCRVASFDDPGNQRTGAVAALGRGTTRVGFGAGTGRDTLPAWLTSGNPRGAGTRVDSNDLTLFAQKRLGREGMVSIAGTLAKAKVMTPAEASTLGLPDSWTSKRLSLGGGVGNFSVNIVGHVVETPGQPKWQGLGVGLTWRTPWSGQLTVGAENVVTKGKNPFSISGETADEEGTVPYVRYEQNL
ncbi:hypothetical protein [Luteimonas vadosa]|uniref:XOO1806 family protein n=1 Tax=Luteimonas vadosa TaxID=1165507 RepID=UPI0031E6B6F2